MNFFDDKNTGKLAVTDVIKALQDSMASQTGGGLYAFMQVQPILQKIINELAVDCDKFFDEVADLNEQLDEDRRGGKRNPGLNKRLFYSQLHRYGVQLDEDEKTLINTVFTLVEQQDKFDYEKLDAAFEGVQAQLYAQGKQHNLTSLDQQYTIEWQRRIFRKIGEYLRRHNITVQKCFSLIDEDHTQTISMDDLKAALIRFQISLTDKEIKVFLQKLDE